MSSGTAHPLPRQHPPPPSALPPLPPLVTWHWYKSPHDGSLPECLPASTAGTGTSCGHMDCRHLMGTTWVRQPRRGLLGPWAVGYEEAQPLVRHETARRAGALLSTTLIGASAAIWQFGNSTIWPRCCGSVCHRWLKGARCRQKPVRVDTSADVADCAQVRPHADTAAGLCWRELLQAETGAGRCRTPAQKMLQGDTAVGSNTLSCLLDLSSVSTYRRRGHRSGIHQNQNQDLLPPHIHTPAERHTAWWSPQKNNQVCQTGSNNWQTCCFMIQSPHRTSFLDCTPSIWGMARSGTSPGGPPSKEALERRTPEEEGGYPPGSPQPSMFFGAAHRGFEACRSMPQHAAACRSIHFFEFMCLSALSACSCSVCTGDILPAPCLPSLFLFVLS